MPLNRKIFGRPFTARHRPCQRTDYHHHGDEVAAPAPHTTHSKKAGINEEDGYGREESVVDDALTDESNVVGGRALLWQLVRSR
jgi:hypothetical protein